MRGDNQHRFGQLGDPGDATKQRHSCPEGKCQSQLAGQRLALDLHAADEDCDEDQIVDPEHDLQRGQRRRPAQICGSLSQSMSASGPAQAVSRAGRRPTATAR